MKMVNGVWIPDDDEHLTMMLGRATAIDGFAGYQQDKLRTSLQYVDGRSCAVDVGANVGLWSRWLVEMFGTVHAYEPLPVNLECLRLNIPGAMMPRLQIHERAIGPHTGRAKITYGHHGPVDASVREGVGPFPIGPIDLTLPRVDYLKIDTAGGEYQTLLGCRELLVRDRPCVAIDVKGRVNEAEIEDLMHGLGAARVKDMSGFLVFVWH